MTFYDRIRQEHWLRDKQDEGKGLILNDDSVWKVHPSDQFITCTVATRIDNHRRVHRKTGPPLSTSEPY